jgi:type II secretory pathway pseudopilin PulG
MEQAPRAFQVILLMQIIIRMKKNQHTTGGYSLIEMLIYVFILSLLLIIITNVIFTVTLAGRKALSQRQLYASGETTIDRLVTEIHNATSTDAVLSTFNSSPGRLVLNSSNTAGQYQKLDFYVDNGRLKLNINGTYSGPLTTSATNVSSLIFRKITATSTAIRIELGLTAGSGSSTAATTLYNTVQLKGI